MEQPGRVGLFWLPVLAEQTGTGPCRNAYCWVTFQPSSLGGCAGFPARGKKEGWGLLELALLRVHSCAEA